ncbi:hypothetical protein DPMN_053335 [Dreissena polymorpha]|uniref:Uncharacterized protein n=1 Tax=Dreissena polymorpha TaxID=45954 RepID=A0A9D4CNJ9_DREPO|nr:hypothetical protein DPMN_053335 [Dreissena polymorpha]
MKYDDITIVLGEFGKYQKILYFLVCLPAISLGIQMLLPVFSLASPSYRCSLPGSGTDSFAVRDIHHAIRINQSIPRKNQDRTSLVYESCEFYYTNENTTYNEFNVPINASVVSCNSWVYDQSTFQKTVITEFDLVCGQELARANANMAIMAGLLVGSLVIGVLSDVFGRKIGIMICAFVHVMAAFGASFPTKYIVFVIFRFLMGFTFSGLFGTAFVFAGDHHLLQDHFYHRYIECLNHVCDREISASDHRDEEKKLTCVEFFCYRDKLRRMQIPRISGVALILSKSTKTALIWWKAHGSRVMAATFHTQTKRINVNLTQCYTRHKNIFSKPEGTERESNGGKISDETAENKGVDNLQEQHTGKFLRTHRRYRKLASCLANNLCAPTMEEIFSAINKWKNG